jgi:phosphoribosylformylglycinamidine synthase
VEAVRAAMKRQNEEGLRDGRLAIPYTLLISAVALIDDVANCVTMDLKQDGAQLYLIGWPTFDAAAAIQTHHAVARLIREEIVMAVHDVSDGGVLTTVAEMCIAADRGATLGPLTRIDWIDEASAWYVVEAAADKTELLRRVCGDVPNQLLGEVQQGKSESPEIRIQGDGSSVQVVAISDLRTNWQAPLSW